ncbi:MAG: 2-C-methyl-D-erythritol 2,4-cyclodiphosphate synthase [Candidatus Omnitrophica bacterium]|nr:2-C-methyl-D-erythritol 2,4-cyclodiphosphate synthase [Candidatus Omnitrophota bacterium]
MYRVGIGYDIHRLVKGRKLFLGGIEIAHPLGLAGHSDADVLVHAIADALLGGAGLGDIGKMFPDDDAQYKDMRSTKLLKAVCTVLKKKRFKIINIDSVLIAQKPRIAQMRLKMESNIAKILNISPSCVSIKATTNEGLGLIGRAQAIAAWAVVLLRGGNIK